MFTWYHKNTAVISDLNLDQPSLSEKWQQFLIKSTFICFLATLGILGVSKLTQNKNNFYDNRVATIANDDTADHSEIEHNISEFVADNLTKNLDEQGESEFGAQTSGKEVNLIFKKGDALFTLLNDAGIDRNTVIGLIRVMGKHLNPTQIKVGTEIKVVLATDNATNKTYFQSLTTTINKRLTLNVANSNGKLTANLVEMPVTEKVVLVRGKVGKLGLLQSLIDGGLSSTTAYTAVNLFKMYGDLRKDLYADSPFEVVFQKLLDQEGKYIEDGKLLYISMNIKNSRNLKFYLYKDKNGSEAYYTQDGKSKRQLASSGGTALITPVKYQRISSHFGWRIHPRLKIRKIHKGIDYAAPAGTPVRASGDGTITLHDYNKSGYGRYIKIKHDKTYTTLYAHLSRFAEGLDVGSRVKKGQIIGYVGMSGNALGPHLHYEIIKNGIHVNPLNVGPTESNNDVLYGEDLSKFQEVVKNFNLLLASNIN